MNMAETAQLYNFYHSNLNTSFEPVNILTQVQKNYAYLLTYLLLIMYAPQLFYFASLHDVAPDLANYNEHNAINNNEL